MEEKEESIHRIHANSSDVVVTADGKNYSWTMFPVFCQTDEVIFVISTWGWQCKQCNMLCKFRSGISMENHLLDVHSINMSTATATENGTTAPIIFKSEQKTTKERVMEELSLQLMRKAPERVEMSTFDPDATASTGYASNLNPKSTRSAQTQLDATENGSQYSSRGTRKRTFKAMENDNQTQCVENKKSKIHPNARPFISLPKSDFQQQIDNNAQSSKVMLTNPLSTDTTAAVPTEQEGALSTDTVTVVSTDGEEAYVLFADGSNSDTSDTVDRSNSTSKHLSGANSDHCHADIAGLGARPPPEQKPSDIYLNQRDSFEGDVCKMVAHCIKEEDQLHSSELTLNQLIQFQLFLPVVSSIMVDSAVGFQESSVPVGVKDLSSRMILYSTKIEKIRHLIATGRRFPGLTKDQHRVVRRERQKHMLIEGKVYFVGNKDKGPRLCVTTEHDVRNILQHYHTSPVGGSHTGIRNMKANISAHYFWRGMCHDIQEFVSSCLTCQILHHKALPTFDYLKSPAPTL